jgi:hypothetical protein
MNARNVQGFGEVAASRSETADILSPYIRAATVRERFLARNRRPLAEDIQEEPLSYGRGWDVGEGDIGGSGACMSYFE